MVAAVTIPDLSLVAPVGAASASNAGTDDSRARGQERAPMVLERQELYPEAWRGKIYVARGILNPSTGVSAHFDAYDPAANTWTQLATPRAVGAATVGNRIYTLGGGTEAGGDFATDSNEALVLK